MYSYLYLLVFLDLLPGTCGSYLHRCSMPGSCLSYKAEHYDSSKSFLDPSVLVPQPYLQLAPFWVLFSHTRVVAYSIPYLVEQNLAVICAELTLKPYKLRHPAKKGFHQDLLFSGCHGFW